MASVQAHTDWMVQFAASLAVAEDAVKGTVGVPGPAAYAAGAAMELSKVVKAVAQKVTGATKAVAADQEAQSLVESQHLVPA